jgi:2-oxoisovalerate dehydrogenase E1 component alpha subunit
VLPGHRRRRRDDLCFARDRLRLAALRVDGNDFLATYAATRWAAERARGNLGATLIELFTYRVGSHSTSDDPSRYRPADEAAKWPLGDPVERLKRTSSASANGPTRSTSRCRRSSRRRCATPGKQAEALGTLQSGPQPPVDSMFEDVYKDMPWYLQRQRDELKGS